MADFRGKIKDPGKFKKIMDSAFKTVDIEGSGFLETSELEQVLQHVAKDIGVENPTKQEVEDIMHQVDYNGDGRLSREQFQTLIEQVFEMMAQSQDVQA